MVTTRGRRSAAAVAAAVQQEEDSSRSRRPRESMAQEDPESSEAGGTIGSRLRKRRFAANDSIAPSDETSPKVKRSRRSWTPVEPNTVTVSTKPNPAAPIRSRRGRPTRASGAEATNKHLEQEAAEKLNECHERSQAAKAQDLIKTVEHTPNESNRPESPATKTAPLETLPVIEQFKELLPRTSTVPLNMDEQDSSLQEIIKHCEKVDGYEKWGKNIDTDGLPTMGADPELKAKALPILANLTTQILHIFATYTYLDLVTVVAEPDSEAGKIFRTYNRLFEKTKKVYATKDAFINIPEVGSESANVMKQGHNANLATFVISCFGSGDVGFYHLNEYFMEIFANDGSRLLKQQASLYLELKTQAYLSAMSNQERIKSVVLDELFPEDLEQRLVNRRPGARPLHQSENDFLERAKNRRKHLENEKDDTAALDMLKDRYKWETFLSDLAGYLNKNFEGLVGQPASTIRRLCGIVVSLRPNYQKLEPNNSRAHTLPAVLQRSTPPLQANSHSPHPPPLHIHHPAAPPPPPPPFYYHLPPGPPPMLPNASPMISNGYQPSGLHHAEDIAAKAARAAQEAFQGYLPNGQPVMVNRPMQPPHHYTPGPYGPPPQHPQHPQQPPVHYPPPHQGPYGHGPPPQQQPHPHQMGPPSNTHSHQSPYPHGPAQPPASHAYYDLQLQVPAPHPHHQQMRAQHSPAHTQPLPLHPGLRPDGHQFHPQARHAPPPGAYYATQSPAPQHYPSPQQMQPPLPSSMYSMPAGQSLPTALLYEKARAVASKSSSSGRNKGSTVSQRRPWTTEEETALMVGLDVVKGPHWSQILALYGPGGTVNEALRDRTQVQLKDKARNLKLFFLKSQIEVPYYLGFVTGELKSRAPSHAVLDREGTEHTPERHHPDRIEASSEFGAEATPAADRPVPSVEDQSATAAAVAQSGQIPLLQNGTYASPYAALQLTQQQQPLGPGLNGTNATDHYENDNIDPAIRQSTHSPRGAQDLARSAAEQAARKIAALNGGAAAGVGGSGEARAGSTAAPAVRDSVPRQHVSEAAVEAQEGDSIVVQQGGE